MATEWEDVLIAKGILKPKDDDDDDDLLNDDFIFKYTQERKKQLLSTSFGSMIEISQPEYEKQVTLASKNSWVLVYLYQNSINICQKLDLILQTLASRYSLVKFVKIQATRCIPNYPDKNVPTIILYNQENVVTQLVGSAACGGSSVSFEKMVQILRSFGVPLQDEKGDSGDESEDNTRD